MFSSPGKETFYHQYMRYVYTTINTSHHPPGLPLSLSSKYNHRPRGIDQIITLSSHYVSYTTINTSHQPKVCLCLSLLIKI